MDNAQKTQMLQGNVRKAMTYAPEQPWNHTDPAELGPCITQFVNQHEPYFRRWAESWFMTMQYVFGQHNFKWSRRNGFAVDFDQLRQKQAPSSYVRAYTNIARIAVESLTAGLYSNIPDWEVDAVDESAISGRRQKKIIESLLDGLFQTLQADKDASAAAFVFAMFGQVAFESGWNPMSGRVIEAPRYVKSQKPAFTGWMAPNPPTMGNIEVPTSVLDQTGRPYMEDSWDIQRDGQGRQIIDKIFTGNPSFGVLTPFEYRRAVGSIGMHKTRYTEIFRLVDYDKWLDIYGQMDGKTRFFDQIQPVYAVMPVYQFALRFFMRMMYVTPPAGEDMGSRWGATMTGALKHKVLVVEHYDEPHPLKWPEGRRVIVANGQCTHVNRPQYNTKKLDGWHPLSEAQWMNSYPSSIASGPMQDLVKKNQELDVMDSFIATAMRRSLGGQYLVKIGSGIDPNRLTGEPGLAHEVTDPYGIRILHDELAIPPVVAQIRQMQMDDAYNQSGSLDSQRGTPDQGKSGYQTKLFEEREEKRLSPSRKAFRTAMAGGGEKLIYALKANVINLDDALMGYLISNSSGEFSPQDVVAFMSQPIGLGTQIRITDGSMVYRSTASIKADLAEMSQNPAVLQRMSTDARVLDKFIKLYGMEELRDSSAPHRDRAERENEAFMDMIRLGQNLEGVSKPIVLYEDDDDIHLSEHGDFIIKQWENVRNNQQFLFDYYVHTEGHRLQKEEKQAKLIAGAALATGQMAAQSVNAPPPNLQQIATDTQNKLKAQIGAQGAGMPQAQGAPPGATPTNPTTPAANTQPGIQKGPPNG